MVVPLACIIEACIVKAAGDACRVPPGDALIALSYAYDRNGNRASSNEQGTLNWEVPAAIDVTARYTDSGRLVGRVDALDENRNFTYQYDPSGNMVKATGVGESYRFGYDEDDRVTSVGWASGTTTKTMVNRYDALGRRVSRTIDGVETRYVLDLTGDMERILCDVNSSGVITAWYVHGPGGFATRLTPQAL